MPPQKDARTKLLDAAMAVIRGKGFAATSVDELCQTAGVTKGAFFHHFRSKEELGVAVAKHFGEMAAGLFATAPYQTMTDPLDRLLAYVDFRTAILAGEIPEYTCLLGTMVQEAYATHPAIRAACEREITGHALTLAPDIAALLARQGRSDIDPAGLALHIQGVLQGAFILAKATGDARVAADSLGHLRRYLTLLFETQPQRKALP
ncbi:TetR/AcrR family transcriptional regulator [Amaricoccus sp.]|uniref:TetR/AcrR family transcriptional regulator n=1 Tax=Amaricoccus sp. TaxID=1872485 RepID=UPI00262A1F31|nr:TetR/AcrR family transcriptional regulator [Amaricoccus sp.]HRO10723.1 TetR/AcrR family transcriptional regulator [Amaricoccus sp.]